MLFMYLFIFIFYQNLFLHLFDFCSKLKFWYREYIVKNKMSIIFKNFFKQQKWLSKSMIRAIFSIIESICKYESYSFPDFCDEICRSQNR